MVISVNAPDIDLHRGRGSDEEGEGGKREVVEDGTLREQVYGVTGCPQHVEKAAANLLQRWL